MSTSGNTDVRELTALIDREAEFVSTLIDGMQRTIVGQKHLIDSLLIGLLSDGHILLEGVPGLAKTLAVKTLAGLSDAKFSRLQFTPDMLPADVTGTQVYSSKREEFTVKQGPVLPTSCWLMKSTARLPRCRVLCSRRCRSTR